MLRPLSGANQTVLRALGCAVYVRGCSARVYLLSQTCLCITCLSHRKQLSLALRWLHIPSAYHSFEQRVFSLRRILLLALTWTISSMIHSCTLLETHDMTVLSVGAFLYSFRLGLHVRENIMKICTFLRNYFQWMFAIRIIYIADMQTVWAYLRRDGID